MIDRLKEIALDIKEVIIWILTPLAFLAGVIYYLLTRVDKAEREASIAKAEKQMGEIIGQKKEAEENAKDSEKAYRDAVSSFNDKYRDDK